MKKINKGFLTVDFPANSYQHRIQIKKEELTNQDAVNIYNKIKKVNSQFLVEGYKSSNSENYKLVNWIATKGRYS